MILLTCTKMPDSLNKSTLATAVGLLFPNPENEKYLQEIINRKNEASACESLFALALLYEQIKELPCPRVDPKALIFKRNDYGKPYFQNSKLQFNISHSKGHVVCVVSYDEELGVDIEASKISPSQAQKLAKRYFTETEQKMVANTPEIFAKLWSRKEAKAKFFGNSVGNILCDDKHFVPNQDLYSVCFHHFSFQNIPITLCTKRDYSTICFSIQ